MIEAEFIKEVSKLGIIIDEIKINTFNKYYELLVENNEKFNLTSIISKEDVYLKHFYDCATLVKTEKVLKGISVCDVGTGAGFPGIVLKILIPEIKLTVLDSSAKKTKFLEEILKKLEIDTVDVICARAEEYFRATNQKYDVVVTRAVAKLNILCELCMPGIKKGGAFISMKANASEEIFKSQEAIKKLNGSVEKIVEFVLPYENSKRTIIIIKKNADNDRRYPRRFSEIKKNPL